MAGSAAMEGWDSLATEGLYFYDFFTLKFSPVKFVVQIIVFVIFLHLN
jgi:hypothetical protein